MSPNSLAVAVAAFVVISLSAHDARAKEVYWCGGGDAGTNSLSVGANWVGGKIPAYGSDTAVFDPGDGNSLFVTNTGPRSGNLWWGSISVKSGSVTIGGGKSFYFKPTSKLVQIHVAEGAVLTNLNRMGGAGDYVTAFEKTGKGRFVQRTRAGYSGASGNTGFTDMDIKEGEYVAAPTGANGSYGTRAKRVFIRSGAKFKSTTYSSVESEAGFFVDKGGTLSFGGGTFIDGISGEGDVIAASSSAIKFYASRTNYVFTGTADGTAEGLTFAYAGATHDYTQSFGKDGKAATMKSVTFGNKDYSFDFSATESMDVRGTMHFSPKESSVDVTSRLFGPGLVETVKPTTFRDLSLTNSSGHLKFTADTEIAGGKSTFYRISVDDGKRLVVSGGRHVGVPNKTNMNMYETMYSCARPDGIWLNSGNGPEPSLVVSNALVRIGSVATYGALGSMSIGAGGVVEFMRNTGAPSGETAMTLGMDGGTVRFDFAKNPYVFNWPDNDSSWSWTMAVGPRGARIETVNPSSLQTYNYRILHFMVSAVGTGETDGGIVFDVPGTCNIHKPQAVRGLVSVVDGRVMLMPFAVTNAAHHAPFGEGDFTLSSAWLSPARNIAVDAAPRLAPGAGKAMRYAGAATLSVRYEGGVAQTFTIGPDDAVSQSLVRAGAGASLYIRNEANSAKLDGSDGKVIVKGGMPTFANGRLKDPVFAFAYISSDVYRLKFMTYDDTLGLVELADSAMTEGLDGGADSVAFASAANKAETVSAGETVRVGALRVDGYNGRVPLTIADGATLQVGNGTDVACVLMNQTSQAARSSIAGPGTLDFGTSEGLFAVSSPMGARNYAGVISAKIAGSGGVTFNGPIGILEPWVEVSGENVYTGGTRINCLEVRASNAKAFSTGLVDVGRGCGSGGQVKFTKSMTMANAFRISGNGAKHYGGTSAETDHGALWFASAGVKLSGDVEIVRSARVTARGSDAYEGVFEGVVSGGRLELMRSTGRVVLANDNSYTGGTEVVCGSTLVLKKGGSAGTGEVHLDASALVFENDEPIVFTNDVSGIGEIRMAGSAPVTFTSETVTRLLPLATLRPGSSFDLPSASGAVLSFGGEDVDLGGRSYTVASIGGTGSVSNGALTVTGAIRPGGVGAIGTLKFTDVRFTAGTKVEIEALGNAADKIVFGDDETVDISMFSATALKLGPVKVPKIEVMSAKGGFEGDFAEATVPSASYSFETAPGGVWLLHDTGALIIVW